ncbi:glucokinase [Aquabacterium sp. J223]|uniref:glucokinase n=1 Tax=Aquabacterium sp. J223 TaxID=2898431 RepID=UPI0021AD69A0|nr:glucokinase [Aquabacterium sp. J223]UUX95623.1 glucokinase [Aquabacterium sp. J223]
MTANDPDARWLLADLGGTNVRFALADPRAARPLHDHSVHRYKVRDFARFSDAARRYAEDVGRPLPAQAVVAAAGPVDADGVRMTNHPWQLDRAGLAAALGLRRLRLVNDFVALAACVPLLADDEVDLLPGPAQPSPPVPGMPRVAVVIGPGTGLGMAGLVIDGHGRTTVLPTEAGHAGIAPADAVEDDLLQRLRARFGGRVSRERLISGPGLQLLHAVLHGMKHDEIEAASAPAPEAIVQAADAGDAAAGRTLDRFCGLLADACGDMVLALGAWDGVWLAGSLPLSLRSRLDAPAFRQRFEAKGRFAEVMRRVPLRQILHPLPGLLGAAALAQQAAADDPA